jgi:myo-inositol-1(or 4)-monophosphatase
MVSSVTSSSDSEGGIFLGENASDVSSVSTAPTTASPSPVLLKALPAEYGLTGPELRRICDELVFIAGAAGKMMLDADPSVDTSVTKNNNSDRVTETDKAIEDMIQSRLAKVYPKYNFVGEEAFKHGDKLSYSPTFVVDPIDGTLNFIHGFPNTAVSLAFVVEKKPVVGVVYNPFRGDIFSAVKGQGAYLTTAGNITRVLPLRPVPAPMGSLNDCLVAIEWGNQRYGPNWDLRTSMAQRLMSSRATGGAMVHSIRSNGSAALDFCYVAAGSIDAFWEGGVWLWDVAAGWIILEEAGGIVASANPGDWEPTLEGRLYFAVRAAERTEQDGVVKELWQLMGDRKFDFGDN